MEHLKNIETSPLINELCSRDGVQYMEAKKGQPLQFDAPEDCFLLVVPPDAMPHKETFKEKKEAVESEFMALLMERAKKGEQAAAEMLLQLLKG